ncbi:MAG: hypothetical protein LBD87_01750 [Prevotellaceae bacterium]|jgi:hypothetical protein|nr:hypothetical protein [Prevotellaceae bacterium]
MPKRYFIRALKSIVYFFAILFLILALIYFITPEQERQVQSFMEFLQRSSLLKMVLFLVVFGLIYPFIGYIAQKAPRSRPFSEGDKETVIKIFANARFVLANDDGSVLTFRIINPVARVTRIFEDAITVDYAANPLVVEGLRRDVMRLAKAVERYLRETDDSIKE